MPTGPFFSTSSQRAQSFISVTFRGAVYACLSAAPPGAGSARRSSFPLGVTGHSVISIN
nr:hypothetical protein [Bacillus velezensis]